MTKLNVISIKAIQKLRRSKTKSFVTKTGLQITQEFNNGVITINVN